MYPYRVFVSYAREDEGLRKGVCRVLEDKGLLIRGDWCLEWGEDYAKALREMIEDVIEDLP